MQSTSHAGRAVLIGVAAGLAGAGAMMAMRKFDETYAPRTIPKADAATAERMIKTIECSTGAGESFSRRQKQAVATIARFASGTSFGALYGLVRGRCKHRSALADGIALGAVFYAASNFGCLPTVGSAEPIWKQELPEIAGELLRNVAYGITAAATYGIVDAAL